MLVRKSPLAGWFVEFDCVVKIIGKKQKVGGQSVPSILCLGRAGRNEVNHLGHGRSTFSSMLFARRRDAHDARKRMVT